MTRPKTSDERTISVTTADLAVIETARQVAEKQNELKAIERRLSALYRERDELDDRADHIRRNMPDLVDQLEVAARKTDPTKPLPEEV